MKSRTIPTVIRVEPQNKKGEYTELRYLSVDYNPDLDDSFFSLTGLKNLQP